MGLVKEGYEASGNMVMNIMFWNECQYGRPEMVDTEEPVTRGLHKRILLHAKATLLYCLEPDIML